LTFMTKKEILAVVLFGAMLFCLVAYLMPVPKPDSPWKSDGEMLGDFLRQQQQQYEAATRNPPGDSGANLLEEMERAAGELAKQFGPAKEAILKDMKEGGFSSAEPYLGSLPQLAPVVIVRVLLVHNNIPTCDRQNGRTRIVVAGLESMDFDNRDGTGPDYERLAAVLAAVGAKCREGGESLTVRIAPMPFVPFESVRRAVEAAARAGVVQIEMEHPAVPF
jgi:hypothetical protein